MGGLSLWHWIIIIAVVAVLFGGRGKISGLMGDFAKGIKAFKAGMKEDETATPPQVPPPALEEERRRAEEEARRRTEEETKRKAEEEARRRIAERAD